jgi:hypothetical protein
MTRRALRFAVFAFAPVALALGGVAACSSDPGVGAGDAGDAGCPRDLPPSCPSPPPSWQNDVQPIIASRCYGCHGDGGIEQPVFDYSTYQGVYKNRSPILDDVYACRMPLPDASPPTTAERETLLAWLVCGAPNN